jgi:ubiquinone/menaquinone biosynthesis C-methylase UbiE
MKLKDGTQITAEQIETLNANGPYSMAVWHSGEVSVGNEEGLAGRSDYFMKLIRESILKNFTLEEIKDFSILDIGCNDGWVLHQLSDLPFKKMVGIEPRGKNIEKGKIVREILKLENSIEYREGDIESLEGEIFDIVICAGVLYHVESIPLALRKIRNACSRMVFIESRCLSSSYITQELKDEIEMRDLVYQFNDDICGVTAQKYESAYHDGSAAYSTIVNIPSSESLMMNLNLLGFENIEMVADPETYRRDVWKDERPLGGVCIEALVPQSPRFKESNEDSWISEYEIGLNSEILSRVFLEPFYKSFCLNDSSINFKDNLLNIFNYLNSLNSDSKELEASWLPLNSQSKYAIEIVKNWRYRPNNKIALEYGKLLNSEGKFDEAILVLKTITTELNADWRATYRANYLLSEIYRQLNKGFEIIKYQDLCLQGNPKFPLKDMK